MTTTEITLNGTGYVEAYDGISEGNSTLNVGFDSAAVNITVNGGGVVNLASGSAGDFLTLNNVLATVNEDAGANLFNATLNNGLATLNIYGTATLISDNNGVVIGDFGSKIYELDTALGGFVTISANAFAEGGTISGGLDVYGTFDNILLTGLGAVGGPGAGGTISNVTVENQAIANVYYGIANNITAASGGKIVTYGTGRINKLVVDDDGYATISGGGLLNGATINGGVILAESESTVKGTITFSALGGDFIDAKSGNLKIKKFGKSDLIDLSGTSIDSSMTTTLGASGTLIVGSIHLDFIKGAGMVLDLTSTSSGVDISLVKKAKASSKEVTVGRNHADALSIDHADPLFDRHISPHGHGPAPLSSHGVLESLMTGMTQAHPAVGDVTKTILTAKVDATVFNALDKFGST